MIAGWTALWHDVECASYGADLPLWRELAEAGAGGGPVLDVGCGTGRVALDLAARGHEVVAVDADPELTKVLQDRARERALPVSALPADARTLDLGSHHPLAILPMQVAQLLGGPTGRASMLARIARHLEPGGIVAIALADPFGHVPVGEALPPLPDLLERDGWVFSSTPIAARDEDGGIAVDRHRQAVSPAGDLTEELATVVLESVTAEELQAEGIQAGLHVQAARAVPPTLDYVGSTVVILKAPE